MTRRAERLRRLTELADIRAGQATGQLAQARADAERQKADIDALRAERHAQLQVPPDPGTARTLSAWLHKSEADLRDRTSALARSQVMLDERLDTARLEEGRRQVLARLRDQAS